MKWFRLRLVLFLVFQMLPVSVWSQESGGDRVEGDALSDGENVSGADSGDSAALDACVEEVIYQNQILRAENAYIRRQYESVITIVNQIQSQPLCVQALNVVLELEIMLGVSYLELGNEEEANKHFLNVLKADPSHEIGSTITLPAESAQRLEDLKLEYAEELEVLLAQDEAQKRGVVVETLYVVVEKEKRQFWLNFVPFGAGQFQSDRIAIGATYATFQGVSLAMTILGASMVEAYRGSTFTFSPAELEVAKKWQYVQIAGIAAFGAFYLASVIQGIVQHESEVTIMHPPSQQHPESETAHYISPFLVSEGGGVSYGVVF